MKQGLQGQLGQRTTFARRLFVKGILLPLTLLGLLPISAAERNTGTISLANSTYQREVAGDGMRDNLRA